MPESKKLQGLIITLVALAFVLLVAIVAISLLGVDGSIFVAISSQVTGIGTVHQGSQMMADRSPNYPTPPTVPAVALRPPPVV